MMKSQGLLYESAHKSKVLNNIEEELAKTYLKASGKAGKAVRHGKKKRSSFWKKMPWIVAGACLCVALAAIILSSNLEIKVRMAGGAAFIDKESPANLMPEDGVFLVSGGEPNSAVVKGAVLFGDARQSSCVTAQEVTLRAGSGQGWADYKIEFNAPVNLKGLSIRYAAKGELGSERLILMIIDSENGVCRIENEVLSKLDRDWNVYTVNPAPLKKAVDLTRVSALKFEFGTLTTGNLPKATIYLKDVSVIRNRRLKWL